MNPENIVYPPSSLPGLEILSCVDQRPFARHLHDGYVLWLNSEAPERFSVKGGGDVLTPGAVSIIEPGVIHENAPCDPDNRHLRSFYFSEDFLAGMHQRLTGGAKKGPDLRTCVIHNTELWRRLAAIHESMLHGPAAPEMEDALRIETAVHTLFARLYQESGANIRLSAHATDDWRPRAVVEHLRANLDRPVSLDELASLVSCSTFHLIRIFREQLGVSPHAFLVQLRLERARRLMERGVPIAEAALSAGLSDQSHLTRKFKARYGVTPGRYLKQRRGA